MIKKRYIISVIIIIIILIFGIIFSNQNNKNNEINQNKESNQNKVCTEDKRCINVEIANTLETLEDGLMYRESLDSNSGMLFVFPIEGIYSFWMKNTFIPLDIIWLDSLGKIVYIQKNATPCKTEICESYTTTDYALYVLEINSGKSDELDLNVGDNLEINL